MSTSRSFKVVLSLDVFVEELVALWRCVPNVEAWKLLAMPLNHDAIWSRRCGDGRMHGKNEFMECPVVSRVSHKWILGMPQDMCWHYSNIYAAACKWGCQCERSMGEKWKRCEETARSHLNSLRCIRFVVVDGDHPQTAEIRAELKEIVAEGCRSYAR
jgi:hypothetical protein